MALGYIATAGGILIPAWSRTDADTATAKQVPESLATFLGGTLASPTSPTQVTADNPLPAMPPMVTSTGTLATTGDTVAGPAGYPGYLLELVGSASLSGFSCWVEASRDGVNFQSNTPVVAVQSGSPNQNAACSANARNLYYVPSLGARVRVRCLSVTSGTVTAYFVGVAGVPALNALGVSGTVGISGFVSQACSPAWNQGGTLHTRSPSGGSAATTNSTSVKTSQTRVYCVQASNVAASVRFLKIYNKASAPTVGTDTPVAVYALPPGWCGLLYQSDVGRGMSAGIAYAITAGAADSDVTAVGAGDVHVCFDYA